MSNITVTTLTEAKLEDVLVPGERLIWSGRPAYGRRFFQPVGDEKVIHISLFVGALVMWSTLPFIQAHSSFGNRYAFWAFSAFSLLGLVKSAHLASQREYVLCHLLYFLTDQRAIICRRGLNWRLGARLYVVSCPHSYTYSYPVLATRPYPSLQVGTMFSFDQVQPFGLGLSHPGQPILWGRTNMPVVFEYIPNANELKETIYSLTTSGDANATKQE